MMNTRHRPFPPAASLIVLATLAFLALLASAADISLAQQHVPDAIPGGAPPPVAALVIADADPSQTWTFSGRVYDGSVGDESNPIAGATVKLYCSQNAGDMGTLYASTATDYTGWYGLTTGRICEYYNIVETDPSGYTSVGATSVSGTVKNSNWIQYTYPLTGKTLTGNKFWDRSPATATRTRTPTMRITDTRTATGTPRVTNTRTRTGTATATRPPGPTWTPTATASRTATPTVSTGPVMAVSKTLWWPIGPVVVSDTVQFQILIENTGSEIITAYSLQDSYPTAFLEFKAAYPSPDDSIDDGDLFWSNLATSFGPIAPGQSFAVYVDFHLKAPTGATPARNCAYLSYMVGNIPAIVGPSCAEVSIGEAPSRPTFTPTRTPSPTATSTPPAGPNVAAYKVRLSPLGPVVVSDTVRFEVGIENNGPSVITAYSINDQYPTAYLEFLSAVPPPDDGTDDGNLSWSNLATVFGPIMPGQTVSVVLNFHAKAPTGAAYARNCASVSLTVDGHLYTLDSLCAEVSIGERPTAFTVDKHLISPPSIVVSDTVIFQIDITNNDPTLALTNLALSDAYNTAFLSYLGATPPSDDNIDDGAIHWTDLTTFFGPILPGQTVSVQVRFHARAPTGLIYVENCARAWWTSNTTPPAFALAQDCDPYAIAPRVPAAAVDKTLLSPPVACVSDTVIFGVTMTNTGDAPITSAVFTDTFDASKLSPPGPNTGQLVWPVITSPPLAPGASTFFTLSFHADAPAALTVNDITVKAESFGVPAPTVGDGAAVEIVAPGPCTGNYVVNGGFESPLASPWFWGGTMPAEIVTDQKHSGGASLRLGWPGGGSVIGGGFPSYAEQFVPIPSNAAHAMLTFWYRMRTVDFDPKHDQPWHTSATSMVFDYLPLATTEWRQVTVDLDAYIGTGVWVSFGLIQGDVLPTTVWIDDIEVCMSVCGPPQGNDPPGGGPFCWKQGGYPDYAPNGVPDFDMKQAEWITTTRQWTHDAAVAAADSLWWFDSKFEPLPEPPAVASDHYPLVQAYGRWDDHDPQNVVPLVNDLAGRMQTDVGQIGTRPGDVAESLRTYLVSKQLAISYTVTFNEQPSYDWVRDEVKRSEDVILLLGFWELQPGGWRRLGGHYVTAAGVSCLGDIVALSDPWRDNAEVGGPGRVAPLPPHPHPAVPPDTVHNDAGFVSHDFYGVFSVDMPAGSWGLARYASRFEDVANFFGANVPDPLRPFEAERYGNGAIVTIVERAIAVSPAPATVTVRVEPGQTNVSVDQIFEVDLVVSGSGQQADLIAAHLDFDPAVLVMVDDTGAPISWVVPGPDFPAPVLNVVDNTLGHIDYAVLKPEGMTLAGSMKLATLRFRALSETPDYGSPLAFTFVGERMTAVAYHQTPLAISTANGFVSVAPARSLVGFVDLQGRPIPPDPSWVVPLVLTLHDMDDPEPLAIYAVTTDPSGRFEIPDVPAATYDLKIKGLHTLRNSVANVAFHDGLNVVYLGVLREGDASNDNIVNALDLAIYAASAGKSSGQPGFDPRADFNGDGAVNHADLGLLAMNFGLAGDIEVGEAAPGVTAGRSGAVLANGGLVDLSLRPPTNTLSVGQIFTLAVEVQAGTLPVHAIELHVDLPAGLVVVAPDGTPVEAIESGGILPVVVLNHADNEHGTIDFAAAFDAAPPTGTFTLATIRLRATQPLANQPVRFARYWGRMTDVFSGEGSVLGDASAAWVTVAGAVVTPTATPSATPTGVVTATRTATAGGVRRIYLPVIVSGYSGAASTPVTSTSTPTTVVGTPTATGTPGTLIFSETFDGGALTGWTANNGDWNNPCCDLRGEYTSDTAWDIHTAGGSDIVYEGTVTLLSGNAVGLTFRSSANGTSSYDVILDAVQNWFKISKRSPYQTLDSYPVTVQYNQPYRLKVVANGSSIAAYLDGVLRLEVTDSTYTSGQFGVMLHRSSATYDNLIAWELP